MVAPTQLSIATQSVTRLLREDISYQKELLDSQGKVATLEAEVQSGKPDEDGNRAHMLKQLQQSVVETQRMFPLMRQRISEATAKLEEQIALAESNGATATELELAKVALQKGQEADART
ncbi:hypothetical protein B0T11DRAFT_271559, partial [Plectosphaerella cucumerina]